MRIQQQIEQLAAKLPKFEAELDQTTKAITISMETVVDRSLVRGRTPTAIPGLENMRTRVETLKAAINETRARIDRLKLLEESKERQTLEAEVDRISKDVQTKLVSWLTRLYSLVAEIEGIKEECVALTNIAGKYGEAIEDFPAVHQAYRISMGLSQDFALGPLEYFVAQEGEFLGKVQRPAAKTQATARSIARELKAA